MNSEGFLAALAHAGDGPAQIQQMRKVIIALAISGKLTNFDRAIGSAQIEDVDRSGAFVPAAGRSPRRKKSVVTINQDHLPEGFDEPSRFIRLGSVATIEKGRTGIKGAPPGPYPMVVTAAERMTSDHYDFDGAAAIVPLVSSTGHGKASLHRLHYQEGRFALGTILAAIFPHDPQKLSARFLYEYLTTFKDELLVSRMIGTANVSLSIGKIAEVPVPLVDPSTQKQVDELMALCDQLEGTRAQREATRDRLAAASLARLSTPDPDTFPADARFALDALPALTARPDQIKQLRQAILNLAVRGKLVPQDPSSEPATSLLKKIASLRSKKLEGGYPNEVEARAQLKKLLTQRVPDQLDPLPAGWTWATLMQCSILVVDCKNKTAPYAKSGVRLIRTTNVRDGQMNNIDQRYVDQRTYEEWSARCTPEPGDVLITREAPMGEVCLIPPGERICLGQRMMLARLPADLMDPRFILYSLQDPRLMDRVQDKPIGATVQHLRVGGVETLLMPVPPLEEQRRIVAKLDELMALCDQLEASLTTGEAARSQLLEALLHGALAPTPAASCKHPRAAVSGYVVSRLASRRNFGRTAHMKHLYLAESRLGLKLGGRYMRQAAGPLDTDIYALEKQAEAAGWYTHSVETLPSGHEKVSYVPGKGIKALAEEGVAVLGHARIEMDRLIDLMGGLNTEQVEIIATLFAAWNDALLDGHTPDDDWIVKEVREHWHASKQRFAPAELHKWLGWMRQNDVVPLGHPPRTTQQTTMEF
ncbi:restriction endonuclease subunit S [Rhodanobacter lindaniclasticus]|nr:restriction endonuclease subunit S [Rhodanobacter lindaniclasticus]